MVEIARPEIIFSSGARLVSWPILEPHFAMALEGFAASSAIPPQNLTRGFRLALAWLAWLAQWCLKL